MDSMVKAQKYMRYVVAVYMAIYFVFNASFVHNHNIDGHKISHAHPFTGKQHTENTAELIFLFNSTASVAAETLTIPGCNWVEVSALYIPLKEKQIAGTSSVNFLRGPPFKG